MVTNVLAFARAHKTELLIFTLAISLRVLYLSMSLSAYGGDFIATIRSTDCYFTLSQNVIAGHGYSCDVRAPYGEYSVRPPIYPYYLIYLKELTGSYWGPLIVEMIVGSLIPLLAMVLVGYFITSRKLLVGLGYLLALEPFSVLFSTIFYSETIFTFLLMLSVLFLFQYFKTHTLRTLVYSAFFMGFATLTRPTVEFFPIVIVGLLFWEARKRVSRGVIGHVMVYLGIFLIVLSPWLYRNYRDFSQVSLSPQGGSSLYSVLVPSVLSVRNGTSWGVEFEKNLAGDAVDPNEAKVGQSDNYIKKALPVLLANPGALFLVSLNTSLNFFIHDGVYDVLRHLKIRADQSLGMPALFLLLSDPLRFAMFVAHYAVTPLGLIIVGRLAWVLITILFVLGSVLYLRKEGATPYALLSWLLVLYFMSITLLVGLAVNARYRFSVNFIILAFALYGADYLYRLGKARFVKKV